MNSDLSLQQAIADPLISLLRQADGVSTGRFANLLETAASAYEETALSRLHARRVDLFYRQIGAGGLDRR